jgi:hypothetical protein
MSKLPKILIWIIGLWMIFYSSICLVFTFGIFIESTVYFAAVYRSEGKLHPFYKAFETTINLYNETMGFGGSLFIIFSFIGLLVSGIFLLLRKDLARRTTIIFLIGTAFYMPISFFIMRIVKSTHTYLTVRSIIVQELIILILILILVHSSIRKLYQKTS